jgi:hypothetical protein
VLVLVLVLGAAGCGSSTTSSKPSTAPAPARPPVPSAAIEHALLTAIKTARSCLTEKGLRVSGGPIYPQQSPTSADGELLVGKAKGGAYIAFYTDAGRAEQLEPEIRHIATRAGGTPERRGAVTLLLFGHPPRKLRNAALGCAFS